MRTAGANAAAHTAGAKTPAGTKGSNPKTNASATSNILTATDGDVGPQSAQNMPANANAASGGKRHAVATATATATTNNAANGAGTAAATANDFVTPAPVNGNPAPVQQTSPPASATKTPSNGSKSDGSKDSDATDATATAAIPGTPIAAQAAANPTQPVAAAIAVAPSGNTAPPAVNGAATNLTVGDQTKARPKLTLTAQGANQDTSAPQDATDAGTAKETPSTTPVDNTANATASSAQETTKAQGAQSRSEQQQPTQAANDTTTTVQTPDPVPANSDHTAAQIAQTSPASTSQNATSAPAAQGHEAAKSNGVDGLPNFDFSVSAATASSATAASAPSSYASAGAVPIAGLAVAIAARAHAGSNQFDISLSPPELGRIDVQLSVDGNGHATTHMTVDRPETLQLLQSQQPQLQNALEQAGLTTADNGLQFTLRDQSFTGQNNGSGSRSAPTQLVIPDPQLAPVVATQIYTRMGLGGGVDIRV